MFSIDIHKEALFTLCDTYHVDKLFVFGSAMTNKFTSTSDIDFLVKFKPFEITLYFDNYMFLKQELKTLFNREIDLLEEQTLKNPILINSINKNKALIYG